MLDGNQDKPLYIQVRESLTRRIAAQEWPPGSKLPGELELCKVYRVSRITMRQALKELQDDGRIERRQGSGTIVKARQFVQNLSSIYSFSEEMLKLGVEPSSAMLDFAVLPATEEVASHLSIEPGAPVYSIKRIRMAKNEPYVLDYSYVPVALAPSLDRKEIEKEGLYHALMQSAGISPQQAEETFCAAALPAELAPLLAVKKHTPVLLVERVASFCGTPVEFCVTWLRSDRFKFKVSLK